MPKGIYNHIVPPWNKGKKCPQIMALRKGKTFAEIFGIQKGLEIGRKISESRSGIKNMNYKHGRYVGMEVKGTNWNRKRLHKNVKERDDYTCQSCGLKEPEIMEVDHVKSKMRYPELANEVSNLITLCPNCHARKTKNAKEYSPYFCNLTPPVNSTTSTQ